MTSEQTPSISQMVKRSRWVLGALILCTLMAALLNMLSSPKDTIRLSIHNSRSTGAMALAESLRQRGTPVEDIYTKNEAARLGARDALVVVNPNKISDKSLRSILDLPTNVIFLGTFAQANRFDPYMFSAGASADTSLSPRCDYAPAAASTEISPIRGSIRPLRTPTQACFPVSKDTFGFLMFTRSCGTTLSFIASGNMATNSEITKLGNAAFLLNFLGQSERIGWLTGDMYQQGTSKNDVESISFPNSFTNALVLLFSALLVFALATGRRLGRVVPEEMPVIVPGAEVIYGRARLYRRSAALETAANTARRYSARIVGQTLHVPTPASQDSMVSAISRYTEWNPQLVQEILYGETPKTTEQLKQLLSKLRKLTHTVTHQER